jgi:tripartite-type tricarboxylate transporter receptor subunit TctC
MKSSVQRHLVLAALISALLWSGKPGFSQEFPSREIKLICGFAPGGGADITYRFIAEKLRLLVGKPVIVENRPGLQGYLAATEVAKSKPDGHTIMLAGGSGLSSVKFLFKNPPIDPMIDFEYVGSLLKQGWYLSVDAKSPIKSIPELTEHLKTKGNKASYATSTNIGTVFAELYKAAAGVQPLQVNYRTVGDSLNDLASGQVDMAMTDPPFTIGNVGSGKIRALAVSSGRRVAATPDVPAMAEFGYKDIDFSIWWSIQVAAGTPKPIRDQLARWFEAVLQMEDTRKFFASIGSDVFISSPEQTRALILQDMDRWRDYVERAKIEPM